LYIASEQRYETMQYRRCGTSGLQLPLISLGLWHNFGGVDTFENSRAMVRAFDLGITHFDLANNYGPPPGSAESNFGEMLRLDLKPHRDELIVSTKAGWDMWPGPYGNWFIWLPLGARMSTSASTSGTRSLAAFIGWWIMPATPQKPRSAFMDRLLLYTRWPSTPTRAAIERQLPER
jgi:L-glyceraldehyde 3-phosphate reductase